MLLRHIHQEIILEGKLHPLEGGEMNLFMLQMNFWRNSATLHLRMQTFDSLSRRM